MAGPECEALYRAMAGERLIDKGDAHDVEDLEAMFRPWGVYPPSLGGVVEGARIRARKLLAGPASWPGVAAVAAELLAYGTASGVRLKRAFREAVLGW
jgi:hypothetical protein